MKKEDLIKIGKYLENDAVIKCQDILRVEANINSETFELVDIKHRDYICRVYNLFDIYEILQEFPELYIELYGYWVHTVYKYFKEG